MKRSKPLSDDLEAFDAVLRTDFVSFLRRCSATLNPGVPFKMNWHIAAMAYQLEEVRAGRITRLIVNMPPRNLKSITFSVALPAFLLGHNPRLKIFGISYGNDLSAKHASDFRSIVTSDWFLRAFPGTRMSRWADSDAYTTSRGFRRATSINSALTGLGGDCFIIDDPQKPVDAQSDDKRNHLNQWFSNTLLSRLDDKRKGSIILVMQRVHMNDLTGFLTENSDDWTVLSLPAIAEAEERIAIGGSNFHLRHAGEALHPEREPIAVLEKLRTELGSHVFAAQYQQAPVPAGGLMIRRTWLRYYDIAPERTYGAKIIQSWDTAAKTGAHNDWSVCTTWLLVNHNYYLLDVTRGRYEYPALRDTALAIAKRYKPDTILIEDASTGIALGQELKRISSLAVRMIPVEHNKVGRLFIQQAKFEAGLVHFPRNASFMADLEAELLSFPEGKTDDRVDSISQALAYKQFGYDTSFKWV